MNLLTKLKEKYSTDYNLEEFLSKKIQTIFDEQKTVNEHPVVKASQIWSDVSFQLKELVGGQVYNQWFKDIIPVVWSNQILILKTNHPTKTRWINSHYHKLIDVLVDFHQKGTTSFFISNEDCGLKSTGTKIYGQKKKKNRS